MPEREDLSVDGDIPDDVPVNVLGAMELISRMQRRVTRLEDRIDVLCTLTEEHHSSMDKLTRGIQVSLEEILRAIAVGTSTQEKVVSNLQWVIDQVTTAMTALQKMPGIAGMMQRKTQ